jgi:integrase
MKDAWASFRKYLIAEKREAAFVRGDPSQQWQVIDLWEAWLHETGVARTSINTYWRGTSMLLEQVAQRQGMTNPFAAMRAPKPAALLPRCIAITDAPILLAYVREGPWPSDLVRSRNIVMLLLMVPHGLRRNELLHLTCGDIDLRSEQITIRNAKGRNGGKTRTVMMSADLSHAVQRYVEERTRAGRLCTAFLVSATRDCGIGVSTIRRFCAQLSTATGVRFSPHMLRHTTANVLRVAGVNDKTICAQLGWSDPRMLQRYSHVEDAERAAAMRAVTLACVSDLDQPSE